MTALVLALGLAACGAARAGAPPDTADDRPHAPISVVAEAHDEAVQITARAVLQAPSALVWDTLTDYDHLARFVPGLSSSHVVARDGQQSIVEQQGGARWWLFSYPIRVTLASSERPPQGIEVHLVQGNLRRLDGGYRIVARPDGSTELTWHGLIEPDRPLPAFMRTALLRISVSDQFSGMVREIERRAALLSSGAAALAR